MAKKRSLFDDRPQEIQELTYIIREDIANLNKQIAHLQGFMKKQQQNQQQNTKTHSANVVVALQSKLASMSSEFKQVLEVRTEVNLFYSKNVSSFKTFFYLSIELKSAKDSTRTVFWFRFSCFRSSRCCLNRWTIWFP